VNRVAEFLLVGGATLVLLPIAWLLRKGFGLDASEFGVSFTAFYAAYLINDPHFSVTYLLFYRDARRATLRWILSGIVVPIVLAAWGVAALVMHSAQAVGWMVQLMYLLVGWHYAKQGFGVVTVLSAKRGVRWAPRERKALLAHAYAGWAFAWANPASPAGLFEEKGVVYTALAHPRWLEIICGVGLGVSSIVLVVLLTARLLRDEPLPLAPLAGFLITIWSWTIFSNLDPLLRYVIPALHSIQYLYFVWLLKRNQARAEEGPPSFGRPVAVRVGVLALSALALGWFIFHGGPAYVDGMFRVKGLGDTPFGAVLFVIVNVHHYFMDTVIWRRDSPPIRFLV
jgi:hypothetical protein